MERTLILGYLHEIWLSPQEDGQLLESCIPFGPSGDGARALQEDGSYCILFFWANSHFEAMTYYYQFFGRGRYSTNEEWDHTTYPLAWVEEQRNFINRLQNSLT